jgi:DNA-binding GntR family transcriptional regulator
MVEYKSIKDHVYDYLVARIDEGGLKQNEKIDEKSICEDLQVSRTPVRESLIELANEGYLDRIPRRGYRVKEITDEEIKELYAIVGNLEGLAASLAYPRMTPDDFDAMKKLVERMDECIKKRRRRDYYKFQQEFHDIFVRASGNTKLYELLLSLKKRFIRRDYSIHKSENAIYEAFRQFNGQHEEILRLLKNGELEELKKYLKETHWQLVPVKLNSLPT